jgi:hypothetical protein
MNPTLEVQIIAKIDKLDAGLKMAETKVNQSAQTMGKAGEQGGSQFAERMIGNMAKGLAMGAISNVLGNGILTALQGINAGKSGEDIGLEISKGIVDGAKGIPVVGTIVSIFDEIVNGANRAIEKLQSSISLAVKGYMDAFDKMKAAREGFIEGTKTKVEDVAVMGKPKEDLIELSAARQKEEARKAAADAKEVGKAEFLTQLQKKQADERAQLVAKQDKMSFLALSPAAYAASKIFGPSKGEQDEITSLETKHQAELNAAQESGAANAEAIETSLAQRLVAIEDEKNKKLAELQKERAETDKAAADKSAAEIKATAEKAAAAAIKAADDAMKIAKQRKKDEYDAAIEAQNDIINAEKQAQEQTDKVGRVDQLAGQAAQGMINSGQTALGQFNFAQEGAGATALDMAKKQVASLEKIEAATLEQVRLTKENKGFL